MKRRGRGARNPAKGARSGRWVGNQISYGGAHGRIRAARGSASQYPCMECGGPAKDWAYRGGDPDQLLGLARRQAQMLMFYSPHPEFYDPVCRKCHNSKDAALASEHLGEYRSLLELVGAPDAGEIIRRTIEQSLERETLGG